LNSEAYHSVARNNNAYFPVADAMTQHIEQTKLSNYDLAEHSVRVRKSGTLLDVHSLWNMNGITLDK